MVWFQCEDCGENLKKPKVPNHFRICSAYKLSCIDCGEIFGRESVQAHTQCISEAEKYGPKGQGKVLNGANPKSNKDTKQQLDFDINVGLSERPPWFCSLCNTNATSKQTLLLHADGKKHRAKARAYHAANKQPKQTEESAPDKNAPIENAMNGEFADNNHVEEQEVQDTPNAHRSYTDLKIENGKFPSNKRKSDVSGNIDTGKKTWEDITNEVSNGVIDVEGAKIEKIASQVKKAKHSVLRDCKAVESDSVKADVKKKIKWKKFIKSALRTNPDGVLKMKRLKKLVLKSLRESGVIEDETQLSNTLVQKVIPPIKINSSSRFRVDGKYVLLANED